MQPRQCGRGCVSGSVESETVGGAVLLGVVLLGEVPIKWPFIMLGIRYRLPRMV